MSSVRELPSFGGSPLGGKLSSSESDFSGSESWLSLIALVAGGFLLLVGAVAWSFGANRFISFSMDSMVELIWVMVDSMSASTLSVPWCDELADSFSSESRFCSSAGERGSLSLIFSAGSSLSTERAKQQASDLPEGSLTQLIFPGSCAFSRDFVATSEQ